MSRSNQFLLCCLLALLLTSCGPGEAEIAATVAGEVAVAAAATVDAWPTSDPAATYTPNPTLTARPTLTAQPTLTPASIYTAEPSHTPRPTYTPPPSPTPTETPTITPTRAQTAGGGGASSGGGGGGSLNQAGFTSLGVNLTLNNMQLSLFNPADYDFSNYIPGITQPPVIDPNVDCPYFLSTWNARNNWVVPRPATDDPTILHAYDLYIQGVAQYQAVFEPFVAPCQQSLIDGTPVDRNRYQYPIEAIRAAQGLILEARDILVSLGL